MSERKFKVGDVVYVTGRHQGSLRGPYRIEKQHKGNGNLFVDGTQFSEWGTSRGGSTWTWLSLILAGSPEHDAAVQAVRRGKLLGGIADIARSMVKVPESADLDAAERALVDLRHALKWPSQSGAK